MHALNAARLRIERAARLAMYDPTRRKLLKVLVLDDVVDEPDLWAYAVGVTGDRVYPAIGWSTDG